MNLQALYDLKERLEYAAIAGTGLMEEDFRLRRAVEALAPLASVNPVFAKINASARALLNAPREERSKRLLDLLSLVDAVVYTQGVSNVTGSLEPIVSGNGSYTQISYGMLQPLLQALSGTGSGRTALIREAWQQHPEYFRDFRVLPHVVGALKDSYAELAEMICQILLAQGKTVIPLLKEGFDPAGKTEMVRRVRLIARLAGASENDWFVSILPDSTKNVREAVIQALSLSKENGQLLLDLCQSERGKLKEAAMRSLAMMEDQACMDQLRKEVCKKPEKVGFLKGIDSAIAADLAADAMQKRVEGFHEDQKTYNIRERDSLIELTAVIADQYSPRVAQFWHWVAPQMERLAVIVADRNSCMCGLSVAEHLQKCFMQAVLWNPRPEVCDLARSLASKNPKWFLGAKFLADMAELSPGELYTQYAPLIIRNGEETASEKNDRIQIMSGFSTMRWNAQLRSYVLSFWRFDALTGETIPSVRVLDGVDPGWLRLLTDPRMKDDAEIYDLNQTSACNRILQPLNQLICWMIDEDNPEVCELVGSWLYCLIRTTGKYRQYLNALLRCGWKKWEGLLVPCVVMQKSIYYDHVMEWMHRVPMTNAVKAKELRQVDQLIKRRKVSAVFGYWPEAEVSAQIAALEADPNWEIVWRRFI